MIAAVVVVLVLTLGGGKKKSLAGAFKCTRPGANRHGHSHVQRRQQVLTLIRAATGGTLHQERQHRDLHTAATSNNGKGTFDGGEDAHLIQIFTLTASPARSKGQRRAGESAARLHAGDELVDPLVDRAERVLAQHGALRLVVELQVHPVDREVAAALLRACG